ncbi:family 78 glycoside hydrolase catalytic domain [Cellulomonas sp. McL0617]|uniref:alpha-L-rhamnosidase n=1 Tax=Cellulomonas sp. McL0617 TaxID=3415675 RepID=UPI003CF0C62D
MITTDHESAPLLRAAFDQEAGHGDVVAAVLRITALGVVEARLNGVLASPDVLTPGWSTYEKRLRYAEWDVLPLVAARTTLVLSVGNGWFRGRLGWLGLQGVYGPDRAAAAELVLTYTDGHRQVIVTGANWVGAPSAILQDDLYDGQSIDTRLLQPADAHLADGSLWGPVREVEFDAGMLEPYIGPPVRRQEDVAATSVTRTADGQLLLDFGQNLVGWLRIKVQGSLGDELTVHHAEVLEDGDLSLRPLRSARAEDRYVLSGYEDLLEPTFTFHGFRYARLTGWPGTEDDALTSVRAVVVGSELRRTGYFECSDPDLNRLHENVVWGMRGNFLDVPSDCPQRDERMGYVGDLGAFAPTATFLYDVETFLRDWLRDLTLEQRIAGGQVPLTAPNTLKYEPTMFQAPPPGVVVTPAPMALWQDGAVWIPWAMWQQYGERQVLVEQAESVAGHLAVIEGALNEDGTMTSGYQLGDWLDPAAPPEDPRGARADREVLATACMFRTLDLASRMSSVLGDDDEAARRRALAERVRRGFVTTYVGDDGRIRSDAPAVYAVAIAFGLLTDDGAQQAGDRLADLVAEGGYVIPTGFIGTPFVLRALSSTGHADTAYRLLTQRECPSWLYQVSMGATTIWERWDAMLPDGRVNPGEMTSFNHYAFGSVAQWMHEVVAGMSPLEPGYERVLFAPQPGGDLTSASAGLSTPFGTTSIQWRLAGGRISVRLEVAPGTEAVLRLPGHPDQTLGAGDHEIEADLSGRAVLA